MCVCVLKYALANSYKIKSYFLKATYKYSIILFLLNDIKEDDLYQGKDYIWLFFLIILFKKYLCILELSFQYLPRNGKCISKPK